MLMVVQRRADAAVQLDGGFDDALPGFRLLLGAALEGVGPCHAYFIALICASIIDKLRIISIHIYVQSNLDPNPSQLLQETHHGNQDQTKSPTASTGSRPIVPDIAPPAGFTFNQFLVLGDEPLMFHTGLRKMFPLNRDAREPHHSARAPALDRLRPLRGRRMRRDERMARGRAAGAGSRTARPAAWCRSTTIADRAPRVLADGEVIDLGGGKRVRYIDTPHTPHGWDAGVLYEESTRTLMCGDLFTQLGDGPALTDGDVVGPAIAAEDCGQLDRPLLRVGLLAIENEDVADAADHLGVQLRFEVGRQLPPFPRAESAPAL